MSDPKSLCGPHVEIVKTDGVRITRCPCGTMHISLSRCGTTVQLAPEYFAEVAQAVSLARTVTAGKDPLGHASQPKLGHFVSIMPFDPSKQSN